MSESALIIMEERARSSDSCELCCSLTGAPMILAAFEKDVVHCTGRKSTVNARECARNFSGSMCGCNVCDKNGEDDSDSIGDALRAWRINALCFSMNRWSFLVMPFQKNSPEQLFPLE